MQITNKSNVLKLMRLFFILSAFLLLKTNIFAYGFPVNHPLLNKKPVRDNKAFYLNFDNANFLWDNEYFNKIIVGYTLIGYYVTPQLEYHFSKNLKINGGVHLLKYSGVDEFSKVVPVYSVSWYNDDIGFTMGSLQGTIMHKVSDRLYFTEKYYTDNIENGIQFRIDKPGFWFDTWLDWQTFIFPGDNKQEDIFVGTNIIKKVFDKNNFSLDVNLTALIKHNGGQIDSTNMEIKTILNDAFGFDLSKHFDNKFITKISILGEFDGYSILKSKAGKYINSGYGVMSLVRISNNTNYFQVGYWYADDFISFAGNPIYQCKSTLSPVYDKKYRNLLVATLFYSRSIYKNVFFGLAGDIYYEVKDRDFNWSVGVSIIINGDFFLTRFK